MRLVLGADHGGYSLKERLKAALAEWGYACTDIGTHSETSVDYPDIARQVVAALHSGQAERGILVCGTGIGMSMVANKYPGIRAALCHDEFTARMSREHNDANVLVLGGRVLNEDSARRILRVWLDTEFAGERHSRRVEKIAQIEKENMK